MIIKSHTHSLCQAITANIDLGSSPLQLEVAARNASEHIKEKQPLIHSWILTFTVRGGGGTGMGRVRLGWGVSGMLVEQALF